MTIEKTLFITIVLGFLVSWIPRVAPFILVTYKALPKKLLAFLRYLPLAILFSLTLSSLLNEKIGRLPSINALEVIASLPTLIVAYYSRNILYPVLTGILSMALIRLFFT